MRRILRPLRLTHLNECATRSWTVSAFEFYNARGKQATHESPTGIPVAITYPSPLPALYLEVS